MTAPFILKPDRRAYRVLAAIELEGPLTRVELTDRLTKPGELRRPARTGVWNAIHHLRSEGWLIRRDAPGRPFDLTLAGRVALAAARPKHKDAA